MNETRYRYSGTLLGTFEFIGTKPEFDTLLKRLQDDPQDGENYDGQIETGSTRDHFVDQKPDYRDCLIFHGEAIAIALDPAAVALGRRGGKSRSDAKRKASAANGKLGGRGHKRIK
jgi:hypothetical protein